MSAITNKNTNLKIQVTNLTIEFDWGKHTIDELDKELKKLENMGFKVLQK